MRYLIISDIHGNLHALDAVLADAATFGYDAVLCLGDLVGYGADPGGVIERVEALQPVAMVRGNHDKVCAGLEPPILFNELARKSVEWTHKTLTPAELAMLSALPKGPMLVSKEIEICHGSPFDEDHYIFDQKDAGRAIASSDGRICLFGHTHLPAIFAGAADPARHTADLAPEELTLPRTGPALINVGSVGQPRDNDPRAAYGLLDLDRMTIRMRRTFYDVEGAQQRILKAGLPAWLAMRLERGQ